MLKLIHFLSFFTLSIILVSSKSDNKPPYFLSNGDFSSFSIPENFQVQTSVYKLKGINNLHISILIHSIKLKFIDDLTEKKIEEKNLTYIIVRLKATIIHTESQ